MRRFIPIVLALFILGIHAPQRSDARNILGDLLKVYQTYESVNMMLWLAGDAKAEKRVGEEIRWFIGLTSKEVKDQRTRSWVEGVFNRVKTTYAKHGFDYNIKILQGKDVNAYAIPGGHIFIYTGMLDFVGSDDELAAVLAHEIAHAERRHMLKQFRKSTALQLVLQQAVKSRRDRETWGQLFAAMTTLRFSREDEREADDLGQEHVMKAGFDPASQVVLWEKFTKKFGEGPKGILQYLSTHPPSTERVQNARDNLKKWGKPETRSFALSFNILADDKENLAANGSFETDLKNTGLPDGWTAKAGKAARDSNAEAPSGKWALCLDSDTALGEVKVLSEMIAVNPSQEYRFGGWIKSEDGTQKVAVGAELYDAKNRLRGIIYPVLDGVPMPAFWSEFKGTLMPGKDKHVHMTPDTAKVRLLLIGGRMSKGKVWFDDLTMQRANYQTPANILANGSFERTGVNGLPDGVTGTAGALARDVEKAKIGYASLRLTGMDGQSEIEATVANLPGSTIKPDQELQFTWHYVGSEDVKATLFLEAIDGNGSVIAPGKAAKEQQPASGAATATAIFAKEFTAKKDLWQANGGRVKLGLTAEEAGDVASWRVRVTTPLKPGQSLWLDGMIVR